MFIDIQQNTDEWLDLRAGKVTGSAISKVMAGATKDKSKFSDTATQLAVNLSVERLTGKRIEGYNYRNSHMDRGHEQEPIARKLYEDMYFCDVTNGGFFDNETTGCSPDGRVNNIGLIEIKSVIASTQYKTIVADKIDSAYRWQTSFNLRETNADWLDYISFCAAFPQDKQLFVKCIYASDLQDDFDKIEERLFYFEKLITQITNNIQDL